MYPLLCNKKYLISSKRPSIFAFVPVQHKEERGGGGPCPGGTQSADAEKENARGAGERGGRSGRGRIHK